MNEGFKPYQLVLVKMDGYSCIGETISFPTLSRTIMVRLVPGDATTMTEVPLNQIRLVSNPKEYRWIQYAKIDGRFNFPIDMLRYDCCAPVSFTIVEDGRFTIKAVVKDEWKGAGLIVGRITRTKSKEWTEGRWHSFCWGIEPMPDETRKYESGK